MKTQIIPELEKDIQKGVMDFLQLLENMGKLYFFRNNSFQGSFNRADGSKGYIKNNKQGMPDIIVCYKGNFIGLEIKTIKGVQSDAQQQAEDSIKQAGGEYHIVRSIDDVKNLFKL